MTEFVKLEDAAPLPTCTPAQLAEAITTMEIAGHAAARVLVCNDPRRGASLLSYAEIIAMASVLEALGYARPDMLPPSRKAASAPEPKGGL